MRIKRFLDIYPNQNTVGVYRAGIYDFFDCLYGKVRIARKVTGGERERYEELAEQYFNEGRDYFVDFLSFIAAMNGQPPVGAKAKIAGVKEFLIHYDIEFTQKQLKQLSTKMPKGRMARTAEKDVDVERMRKILMHMDLKGRAAILTLASSGMRIGELVHVNLFDVELSSAPAEIVIRGEHAKTGDTRISFISSEAKEALAEWLKVRNQFLVAAQNRNRGLVEKGNAKEKSVNDSRLFPFTERNLHEIWDNALKKAGLWNKDNSTGRQQIRIHALRRFFRSQLALSCPLDIVEALMGHEGYLTEAYRRYSKKQMSGHYLKAERHVTVMSSGDFQEMKNEVQDTQMKVEGYRTIITEMQEELNTLKTKEEKRIVMDGDVLELFESFMALLATDSDMREKFKMYLEKK